METGASYRAAPSTGSYGSTPTAASPVEPPAAAPRSAPPAGAAAPYSAPPAPAQAPAVDSSPTTDRADRPFRLRSVPAETAGAPAELSGHQSTPTGPGAAPDPARSGPRRLDPTSSAPAPTSAPPYAARRSAPDPAPPAEPAVEDGTPEPGAVVLPQRVPAEPDVPVVPEPPAVEPPAETPELARIATHLRRDDEPAPLRERPEGFDVNAILDAVREVAGVRDAALRRTPAGAHSLRLDLADGADPAEVSRMVARLLQERMGLAAAPQNLPGTTAAPAPLRRRSAETRAPEARTPENRAPEPRGAEPRPGEAPARPRDPESRPGDLRRQEPGSGPSRRSRSADPSDPGRAPAGTGRGVADQPPGARPTAEAATAAPAPGRVEDYPGTVEGVPRRRRQVSAHRGRASVEEASAASAPPATGSPVTLGTSYSGGQMTTTETAPSRPLDTGGAPGPRVVIDHVQVSTFGLDATVEVRLLAGGETAAGHSTGPAVDGYVLRLCAVAAAAAVDHLLRGADGAAERGRCFVEHAAVVPFGNCEVATVVVLLVCDGWVEQLAGSALVAGDPRQAVVRATLAAVNRRLEALLA
ncbi:Daple [Micromonospora sp. CPCC 206171]|uniref:Daple n=1 Tax=Micromonospora sp. CPCC 206171 TaxID=3122405 RepID=UPI003FA5E396